MMISVRNEVVWRQCVHCGERIVESMFVIALEHIGWSGSVVQVVVVFFGKFEKRTSDDADTIREPGRTTTRTTMTTMDPSNRSRRGETWCTAGERRGKRKRWINKRRLIDEVVDHCYRHHKRRSTIANNDRVPHRIRSHSRFGFLLCCMLRRLATDRQTFPILTAV